MRTTAEINTELLALGQEMEALDRRRVELKNQQATLWAERDRAQAVEEFVRLEKRDRDAFETQVVADDLARAELAAVEAAAVAEEKSE